MNHIDPNAIIAAYALICTGMQTLIFLFGGLFAILQLRETRKAYLLGAFWSIFSELDSDKMMAAREYVYANRELYLSLEGNDENYTGLLKERRTNAELVSSSFSRVGYLVSQDLIPQKVILDGYHLMVTRCWSILEPYIKAVREERNNTGYQYFFEDLAKRAYSDYPTSREVETYTSPPHER
jgi:hypothetical protein